jgi:hypothetical protein
MKKLLFLVIIAFVAATNQIKAQDTTRTLLKLVKPHSIGLYVAPEYQYFGAANSFSTASGGSAMFLLNQRFGIGVAAYDVKSFTPKALNNAGLNMRYNYGGANLEYTFAPSRLIHVSIPLLIGAGRASVDSSSTTISDFWDGKDRNRGFRNGTGNSSFFIVQPGLRLETNLFRYGKLFVGANYRMALGTNSVTYPTGATTAAVTNGQLSGLSLTAGIKLGLFDFRLKK